MNTTEERNLVLDAIIRRLTEAKEKGDHEFSLYGDIERLMTLQMGSTSNNALLPLVESAIDDLKERILSEYNENKYYDKKELEDNDRIRDAISEIADNCIPIYNSELDMYYYMIGSEIHEAMDNTGMDIDMSDKYKFIQQGLYCLVEYQVYDWFTDLINGLDDTFNREELEEYMTYLSITV